jgi:hypothetical protein
MTTQHHILPESAEEAAHDHSEVHEVSEHGSTSSSPSSSPCSLRWRSRPPRSTGWALFLVPALLIMMAIKFFIVVSYFMHLKFDSRLFGVMFYLGLFGAIVLYSVMLTTFHFFID